MSWADFQYEIYLNGMTGAVPRLPTDLTRLEEMAERRLGPGPFGYVAGAARAAGAPSAPTARRSTAGGSCRGCSATCVNATCR